MKIVFAGTPDLTLPTLCALVRSRHKVALVVTQPDRPAGRGRHAQIPPVKELALANGLPIIQPESINSPDAFRCIRESSADAIVVIAYGKRLLPRVLDLPRLGCFNVHFSLLPKYRGAAPINHAVLNGERETGVTIQRMAAQVDTGPILAQRALAIGEEETTGDLAERLAALAAEMIVPALDAIESGAAAERPQDPSGASKAPTLRKSDGIVPWDKSAMGITNFVRGMTPWPGAFTFCQAAGGRGRSRLILLATRPLVEPGPSAEHACGEVSRPGVVVRADAELVVAAGEGFVSVLRVKPDGGKPMDAAAFLRGHSVRVGDRFRGPA